LTSKLTDEELAEIASQGLDEEFDSDRFDIGYYQEQFRITDGNFRVCTIHLYYHYENWSSNPIRMDTFLEMLTLARKNEHYLFVDEKTCNINLDKLLGSYVRREKEAAKKERARQVPSLKSETERED
jgi:hypothetical protein